ncbi:MAG: hypothetical protein Q3986_04830 [Akkermansia sp.]|nr:hypothetical protein [Akkermansia sp.]
MKLHLPKMLTAALLAAFVATTAQAAITMTDITQWEGYDQSAGVAHVGNVEGTINNAKVQQNYQWNNYWNFIYTVDAASLTEGTYSLDTLALTQKGAEGYIVASSLVMGSTGTGTVSHGGWNKAAQTASIDLSSAKDITFVLSRNNSGGIVSLTGYVDGNFDTAAFTLNVNTNLSFSNTTVSTVSYGSTGGLTAFNNGNNTYRQVADDTVGSFDITKAGYLLGSQVTAADLGKYYTPVTTLVWNGEAPSATWDTTSEAWLNDGQPAQYVSGYGTTANFNTGAVAKDVTVSGDIKAATVNVNDDYTFTVQSGSSLTADALRVADDKTATVAGEGTVSLGSLTGALAIEEGSTVNLDGTITLTGTQTLQVSGEGTLGVTTLQVTGGTHTITNALNVTGGGDGKGSTNRTLGLAVTGGTVTLEGDTHISGAMYNAVGTVNIGNGTDEVRVTTNRVEFGDTAGSGESILNVKANATLHVKGTDQANAYANTALVMGEWGGVSVANISGKLYADNATAYVGDNQVTFNIEKGGLMAVKGFAQNQTKDKTETINLNLLDGGTLVLGENGIANQKPVNVHLGAGELGISADSVLISKDVVLTGGATTFNTAKYVWEGADDTRELVKGAEGGTLTINGSITGDGTITKVGAGTLVLSGTNNVLTHTIAANEGSMTLYGSYEIADIAPTGGQTIYTDGEHDNNGYSTATGNVIVYEGDADVTATDATFTFRGSTVTVTDGKYTLPGEQDTTTYFINGGTDSYGWIDEHKKAELTGGIVVTENATLKADKDMSMSVVSASSKGTVQINEGVVVTAAGGTQNVKLAGDGIYALASGAQTLGSVNADNLSGYVRLSGNIRDIDLDGNLQGKNVELNGVSGYLKDLGVENDDEFTGNLRLTDVDGTPALLLNNGYSRNGSHYVLSGEVTGDGTWRFQKIGATVTNRIVFNGDISGWEGALDVASGYNVELTFAQGSDTVNATITREAGALALIVENDATFHKDVTGITSLTVTEEHSATFEGTTSIGSLIGEGDVTVNGDLTLTGTTTTSSEEEGATNFTGTLTLGASLTVNGNVDLGGHLNAGEYAITVQGTGSLTLTEDSTIGSVISNSGFVSLTGLTLDDSVFTETEGEDAHFDLAGHMTDDANYFEGTAADYVRVVNGGTSTGSGLAWGDKADYVLTADGKIITGVENIDYGTFYVGGEISTSAINASEHVADITNINVGDGATLTVDAVSEAAIHAQDGATVAGEHAQDRVEIAADATVTYAYGISSTEGVYVFGLDGVSVTNKGGSAAIYGGLDNDAMAVEADALSSSVNEQFVVNNQLSVSMVTHAGEGELTLAHVNGDALNVVETDTAALILQGITATTLSELTIGGGATVAVYTNTTKETEGTVTIDAAGVLTAGGSTLLANLVMEDDSTLLTGGVEKALHVGSTLTMGSNIALDEATLRKLDGLDNKAYFWLIDAAAGSELSYTGSYGEDAWFDSVFSRFASDGDYELEGDFNIVFDDVNGFGLQKFSSVPEPTTGTLSLLALMALAARRRRH